MSESKPISPSGSGAIFVGIGILLSRIVGLVRERVFAHYFGSSASADAFKAALRIPNVLQNLFGEGVLSGSFIPVYARLRAEGKEAEADRVAGTVASLLALVVAVIVALGVAGSPLLVDLIAPGFADEKRALTIELTKIFFPATGLLVFSAWCLGILNSHGRFLLSYSAPVFWNLVIIATLIYFGRGGAEQDDLATYVAWGVVAGSAVQFVVQLPFALSLLGQFSPGLHLSEEPVQKVVKNFFPILCGRGIVQISAYVDSLLASLLPTGAVAALSYSQTLYLLPVGLFGMSISAAELPAMSKVLGAADEIGESIRLRLRQGLRQISFFIVPSAVAFIVLGKIIIGGVFQTGAFSSHDTEVVWRVLAAATVGLLPATYSRLYASTFYALSDPRTPLRYSLCRVALSVAMGCFGALYLPQALGVDQSWGLVFLSGASAAAAAIEFALLRASLTKRIGAVQIGWRFPLKLFLCAGAGSCAALLCGELFSGTVVRAVMACAVYGGMYFGLTWLAGVPESKSALRRFARLRRR